MHRLSILLGLSGSEQSKYAAELAWSIAKRAEGSVTAQHVIDTRAIWEFFRNDKPGFVGSGLYVDAYQGCTKALNGIAQKLATKFEAVAEGQGVPTETLTAEGSPVTLLSKKAMDHDLVVIGHQHREPSKKELEHDHFVRYAVAEGLAHDCPRPLIVVQKQMEPWSSMSILVSCDHLNFHFINACLEMAELLKLKPKLIVLESGIHEEPKSSLLKDLRNAHPELAEVDIEVRELTGLAVEDKTSLWQKDEIQLDWTPEPETLMVIPTRMTGGHRITIFDTTPDRFIRYLPLPSIMLWPEEYTELRFQRPIEITSAKVAAGSEFEI